MGAGQKAADSERTTLPRLIDEGRAHLRARHTNASTIATDYEGVVAPLFEFAAAGPRSHPTGRLAQRQRAALRRFIEILEEGQAQGSIRRDADVKVAAWSLMGLTWVENLAALEGMDEFVSDGVSAKMLERILADISAKSPAAKTCERPASGRPR